MIAHNGTVASIVRVDGPALRFIQIVQPFLVGTESLASPDGVRVHGAFIASSKISVTFTVFPESTETGSGFGGFLIYLPSEVPVGGGE